MEKKKFFRNMDNWVDAEASGFEPLEALDPD